jgi:hypothetical protein
MQTASDCSLKLTVSGVTPSAELGTRPAKLTELVRRI